MTESEQNLYKQLVNKSTEAFTMAIEIYNKPTLRYRVEGFAFFICNAWELMLKAHLINTRGEKSIYYPDKDNRTISLEKCLRIIFSNENDPLRKNLECIIELRNLCTHFITQEYELIYAPLFQSCVFNFAEKLNSFHGVDITSLIPEHFIHLATTSTPIFKDELRSKYGDLIADKLQTIQKSIEDKTLSIHNSSFAITIRQDYYLTKKSDGNTTTVRIAKAGEEADEKIRIVKEVQDVNLTHPLTVKKVVEKVQQALAKEKIEAKFNKSTFQDFLKYFNLKADSRLCYTNTIGQTPTFSYSMKVVDMIVEEYKKNPMCGMEIHQELRKRQS